MLLNLPFLYFVWTGEYCQTSPNKNKSPNLWHVTSILSKNSLIFDKSDHLPNNYEQKMLPFCNSFWPIFPLIIDHLTKNQIVCMGKFCILWIPGRWNSKNVTFKVNFQVLENYFYSLFYNMHRNQWAIGAGFFRPMVLFATPSWSWKVLCLWAAS